MPAPAVYKGNLASGTIPITSQSAQKVLVLLLTNKGATTATVNLQVKGRQASTSQPEPAPVSVAPKDLQLEVGTTFETEGIILLDREQILISSNVSLDYYVVLQPVI